ncbi:hypothetical protein D3C85_1678640 [compost metagenome]
MPIGYLLRQLEPGDSYRNVYKRMTLPHDSLLDDKAKLAAMSGPVVSYNVNDLKGGEDVERNRESLAGADTR